MSDDKPIDPTPPDATVAGSPSPPPAKQRWRDRTFGIRSLAAVAAASLIIGGLGGAAIGWASGGSGHEHPGRGDFQRPPGGMHPGGMRPDGMRPGIGQPGDQPPAAPAPDTTDAPTTSPSNETES